MYIQYTYNGMYLRLHYACGYREKIGIVKVIGWAHRSVKFWQASLPPIPLPSLPRHLCTFPIPICIFYPPPPFLPSDRGVVLQTLLIQEYNMFPKNNWHISAMSAWQNNYKKLEIFLNPPNSISKKSVKLLPKNVVNVRHIVLVKWGRRGKMVEHGPEAKESYH